MCLYYLWPHGFLLEKRKMWCSQGKDASGFDHAQFEVLGAWTCPAATWERGKAVIISGSAVQLKL